jgi:hypothetical protein
MSQFTPMLGYLQRGDTNQTPKLSARVRLRRLADTEMVSLSFTVRPFAPGGASSGRTHLGHGYKNIKINRIKVV